MPVHPLAGKPARANLLVNVPRLVSAYYTYHPDPAEPAHAVAFGTSGHRGTSLQPQLQRGSHPGDQPGDLRVPRRARGRPARSSSAWTPTRSPSRR